MVYEYKVKHKGKWYLPVEEIPEETEQPTQPYTKTDISRMSTADLQSLATAQGIENAKELSGAELKKLLIEKFGL